MCKTTTKEAYDNDGLFILLNALLAGELDWLLTIGFPRNQKPLLVL